MDSRMHFRSVCPRIDRWKYRGSGYHRSSVRQNLHRNPIEDSGPLEANVPAGPTVAGSVGPTLAGLVLIGPILIGPISMDPTLIGRRAVHRHEVGVVGEPCVDRRW